MAIESNPKRQPAKVTPARQHAPDGAKNTSIAASGGQEISPGGVKPTPSMTGGKHSVTKDPGAWTGPAPSDTQGADA